MQLTSSLLLFAIGASAAATPRHAHKRLHEKRAVGDVVTAVIDGKVVHWINEYDGGATAAAQPTGASPAAAPAPPATAPAAQGAASGNSASASSGASAGNSKSAKTYTPFCGGASKAKRATTAEIAYEGNTGINGDWGCNMQLVESSIADKYDYTIKFSTASDAEQNCVCWNKIGPTGLIDGWFGHSAVSFKLPAGKEQTVAVDADTQGGCACSAGQIPKDQYGAWAATWLEFDMSNASNDGWSGSDISALVPQSANLPVQGMSVCTADGSQCSSLGSGASNNKLAYVKGMEAVDGVGLNLVPGKVRLNVIAG